MKSHSASPRFPREIQCKDVLSVSDADAGSVVPNKEVQTISFQPNVPIAPISLQPIDRIVDETKKLKESAGKWTDVLEGVEWLLMDIVQDRLQVAQIMANICGEEYVIGEGLREL